MSEVHYLLLLTAKAFPISNYEGGDNPVFLYILITLAVSLVMTGIGYLLWEGYKLLQFQKICAEAKVNSEELGYFKGYLKLLHEKDFLAIATNRARFDDFMNRVGHYFEGISISETELPIEEERFSTIRNKLGFAHEWKDKKFTSTRAIPPGKKLNIILRDLQTKQLVTFQSKVVSNNDFYLGIEPTEEILEDEDIFEHMTELDISFQRGRSRECTFESRFVRLTHNRKEVIYIQHSNQVTIASLMKKLSIPVNLMFSVGEEEDTEHSASINFLTNKQCSIVGDLSNFKALPKVDQNLLISFFLDGEDLTCRGVIREVRSDENSVFCRINFTRLSSKEDQILIRFMYNEKKKALEKKKRKKPVQKNDSEKELAEVNS